MVASELVWASNRPAVATVEPARLLTGGAVRPISDPEEAWRDGIVRGRAKGIATISVCDPSGQICAERSVTVDFSEQTLAGARAEFLRAEALCDNPAVPDDSVLAAYTDLVERYGAALDAAAVGISAAAANLMVSDLTALSTAFREAQATDASRLAPLLAKQRAWDAVIQRAELLREVSPALAEAQERAAYFDGLASSVVTVQRGELGVCPSGGPGQGLCEVRPMPGAVLTLDDPVDRGRLSVTARLSVPPAGGAVRIEYTLGDQGVPSAFSDPLPLEAGDDGQRRFVTAQFERPGRYAASIFDDRTDTLIGRVELCVETCEVAQPEAATSS